MIGVKGVLGDFDITKAFGDALRLEVPNLKETLKEILYSLDLKELDFSKKQNDEAVRFLNESDYSDWDFLNRAYCEELHFIPPEQTPETRFENFLNQTKLKHWWGLFLDGELVSMAFYNSHVDDIAQIGAVYTKPEFRRRGFSKRLMNQVIRDSKKVHGLNKLILFTGEDNIAAQKVYESVGFKKIGYFGIMFGDV